MCVAWPHCPPHTHLLDSLTPLAEDRRTHAGSHCPHPNHKGKDRHGSLRFTPHRHCSRACGRHSTRFALLLLLLLMQVPVALQFLLKQLYPLGLLAALLLQPRDGFLWVCVCVCLGARAHTCEYVRVRVCSVCVRARACACVFVLEDGADEVGHRGKNHGMQRGYRGLRGQWHGCASCARQPLKRAKRRCTHLKVAPSSLPHTKQSTPTHLLALPKAPLRSPVALP